MPERTREGNMNLNHEGMLSALDLTWLYVNYDIPHEKAKAIGEYLHTLGNDEIKATIMALISASVAHMDLLARQEDKTIFETIEWFRINIMEDGNNGRI